MFKIIGLLFVAFSFCNNLVAQSDSIHWQRVPQKKVVKLLQQNQLNTSNDFKDLNTHCYATDDSSTYSFHTKTYSLTESIEKVWWAYTRQNPTLAVQKRGKIQFGLMYVEVKDELFYGNSSFEEMTEGQIIFWNLRLMGGFLKIAVGQKVTQVDSNQHQLQICYLQDGKSKGSQSIKLVPMANGGTQIIHQTYFKSHSKFRDRHLYPGLHENAIDAYHRSVAKFLRDKN